MFRIQHPLHQLLLIRTSSLLSFLSFMEKKFTTVALSLFGKKLDLDTLRRTAGVKKKGMVGYNKRRN